MGGVVFADAAVEAFVVLILRLGVCDAETAGAEDPNPGKIGGCSVEERTLVCATVTVDAPPTNALVWPNTAGVFFA